MQSPRQIKKRNNKIILITSVLIGLALIYSLTSSRSLHQLNIKVGDNAFALVDQLKSYQHDVKIYPDKIIIKYIPPTTMAAVDFRYKKSRYELYFAHGEITKITWVDSRDAVISENLNNIEVALDK